METITYKAFLSGAWHYANIFPSTVVDGYHMHVYTINFKQEQITVFEKDYKTIPAAERALKTRFSAGVWTKV